ncbi:N-acetylneuraminate anomerase [Psychromonas hadalis]|uniref:N-acetylneuraminate anomerase n=1 Tax=Psychromonas hadalis TaxID=211669 RepID=UPI0003B63F1A|nr:N-acetylneuraminate anomerase [Psychromonas hadalis]
MIFGHIEDKQLYPLLPKAIQVAIDFLTTTDLQALDLGRHELDGDSMFANVMAFETGHAGEKQAEVHKQYIDVQCLISGEEKIEFSLSNEKNAIATEYDAENDFYLVSEMQQRSELILTPRMFVVFYPGQPHKPGCLINHSQPLKKIVIKVHKKLLS